MERNDSFCGVLIAGGLKKIKISKDKKSGGDISADLITGESKNSEWRRHFYIFKFYFGDGWMTFWMTRIFSKSFDDVMAWLLGKVSLSNGCYDD